MLDEVGSGIVLIIDQPRNVEHAAALPSSPYSYEFYDKNMARQVAKEDTREGGWLRLSISRSIPDRRAPLL